METPKKPNIKLPEGFYLAWVPERNVWQMRPIVGYSDKYLVNKPNPFIPKKEEKPVEPKERKEGTKNGSLHDAKLAKNDEFYTRYEDIAEELKEYDGFFKGKVVYCNCDKAFNFGRSQFFEYFQVNFHRLGLKKLIATQIVPNGRGIKWTYDGVPPTSPLDESEICTEFLKGDGSFQSAECREILKECDVVVTNPPFSLFREFVDTLIAYGKKFLIIGNKNAITYKEIFPLIKDNKLWLGFTSPKGFDQPSTHEVKQMAGLTRWFTNIEHRKHQTPLYLREGASVCSIKYPKYDNYDAINVDDVKMIPHDYDGVMGVPITFLDKYCPSQFEISGIDSTDFAEEIGIQPMGAEFIRKYRENGGTGHYTEGMRNLCYYENDGTPKKVYSRILIRKVK